MWRAGSEQQALQADIRANVVWVQNKPILKILRALLTMTKTLARQEAEFKANCRKQQDDMKARIQRLESQEYVAQHRALVEAVLSADRTVVVRMVAPRGDTDDVDLQRLRQIDEQYDEDVAKLQKVRKLLSKKKRVRDGWALVVVARTDP